jgi:type II secretory pathway pseudopilin PulG
MGKAQLNKNMTILWSLMGGSVLIIAIIALPSLAVSNQHSDERNASSSLRTLTSAQEDFRANDRDGDGVHQFWRADIAGLYTLKSRTCPDNGPIKLIELSIASADDRSVSDLTPYAVRSAKAGYWYRGIRHADEKTPSPDRYAIIAFPEKYPESGRFTIITDENKDIYRSDLGHGRGIEVFPTPTELRSKWSKLD